MGIHTLRAASGMPWHYDKHVRVWETNPTGVFSQWNPSISCN